MTNFLLWWHRVLDVLPASLNTRVQRVRTLTASLCKFVPAASAAASMLTAANPIVVGVVGVSTAICAAVSPRAVQGLLAAPVPTVNGVPVEGHFIK